jgi:hypothetical protein
MDLDTLEARRNLNLWHLIPKALSGDPDASTTC